MSDEVLIKGALWKCPRRECGATRPVRVQDSGAECREHPGNVMMELVVARVPVREGLTVEQLDGLIGFVRHSAPMHKPEYQELLEALEAMRAVPVRDDLETRLFAPYTTSDGSDDPLRCEAEAAVRRWLAVEDGKPDPDASPVRDGGGGVPFTMSDRGLKHYEPVTSNGGDEVLVYESSAADDAYVWLSVNGHPAHLSVANVVRLIGTLRAAIAYHYQLQEATDAVA